MTYDYQKYTIPLRRRLQARGKTVRGKKPVLHGPQVHGLIGPTYQTHHEQTKTRTNKAD